MIPSQLRPSARRFRGPESFERGGNLSGIGKKTRAAVLERDGHCCRRCGRTDGLTLHHVIPIRDGGGNSGGNVVTLCFLGDDSTPRRGVAFLAVAQNGNIKHNFVTIVTEALCRLG
jgi:HNH endonuclease